MASPSKYVIAAICGNFWYESNINPGIWESLTVVDWTSQWKDNTGGYGLGQWTNVGTSQGRLYRLHEWLVDNNKSLTDGNAQLDYLIEENYWTSKPSQGYGDFDSLTQFLNSPSSDLTYLTHYFNICWEGIRNDTWDDRPVQTQKIFDYLTNHSNDSVSWIAKNDWLSIDERYNNAVCVFQYMSGIKIPDTPEPTPTPEPGSYESFAKKMPVWMYSRRRY